MAILTEPPYPALSGVSPTCPKCGDTAAKPARWLPPGQKLPYRGVTFTGEALMRTCQRCGYGWGEEPVSLG
jgi:ribosomal protein S27AE